MLRANTADSIRLGAANLFLLTLRFNTLRCLADQALTLFLAITNSSR